MSATETTGLVEALRVFAREREWETFHRSKNLAMALSVEVAEIVELFQWLTLDESDQLNRRQLAALEEEIGDVMIYLTMLAGRHQLDPLAAAWRKLAINRGKYPADLVRGKALKAAEYQTCNSTIQRTNE
ncbi:MAG: nucleotide pyrophosphohydrolase [Magnetococcales bacterium]|nr:nucleotide pyrophosphohydrolase [Magnetococcales bacterium]